MISLDDLNAQLIEAGYGPVAQRTFVHYRHLIDAGYNRYVSINRFDVARAAAPFENASANGRYGYLEADLGVRIIFAKSSKLLETFGRATEIGEVGAMLRFDDQDVIDGLRQLKPQPGDMVTVRYLEAGRTASGRVVEADVRSAPATIEIEYGRLLSIAQLGYGTPLPTSDVRFVLSGAEDGDQTLDVTSRRLYHFFELVEGVRAVSNRAGLRQTQPVYAEPPVLRSLSVASPAELVIAVAEQVQALVPWALLGGILKAAAAFPEKRKQWYEGTGQKKANELRDHEIRQKELENQKAELEVALAKREAELGEHVLERVREAFPATEVEDHEVRQYIDEFVLPPLRALGRTGIDSLQPPEADEGTNDEG